MVLVEYSLGLNRKTRWRPLKEKVFIFLTRALKENVHEMLESKFIYFIPMLFWMFIFLASFCVVSWFMLLPLNLCLPFLVCLGSTLIGSHWVSFAHFLIHRCSWLIFATDIGKLEQTLNFDKMMLTLLSLFNSLICH